MFPKEYFSAEPKVCFQVSIVVEVSQDMNAAKFPNRQADGEELVVRDLYLQGAQWDLANKQLRPVCPPAPTKMPPLKLRSMYGKELQDKTENSRVFQCPVYTNKVCRAANK